MKLKLFLFTILPFICYSQQTDTSSFQENKEIEVCLEIRNKMNESSSSFIRSYSYDEIVDKILNLVGLKRNFALVECNNIKNAVAYTRLERNKGWVRYIAYDKEFMNKIEKNSNDWSGFGILAHEIGHHLNFHNLTVVKNLAERRAREIEADEFAGFILQKLGANLDEAKLFLKVMTNDYDDRKSTHPKRSLRLKAIETGFRRAKKNSGVPIEKKSNQDKKNNKTLKKPKPDCVENTGQLCFMNKNKKTVHMRISYQNYNGFYTTLERFTIDSGEKYCIEDLSPKKYYYNGKTLKPDINRQGIKIMDIATTVKKGTIKVEKCLKKDIAIR